MKTRNNAGQFLAKFTKEEELQICREYLDGRDSMATVGAKWGCSGSTVRNILKRNGFTPRTPSQAKRVLDGTQLNIREDAFSTYSADSAYWLGALMSDGGITELKNNNYRIELGAAESDYEWVEKFAKWIRWEGKIQLRDNSAGFSGENAQRIARVQIANTKIAQDLIALGCTPRKSLTLEQLPSIPTQYLDDFIRGYVDGDGSIEKDRGRVAITGTEKMLLAIASYLELPYRIYKRNNKGTSQIFFNQNESKELLKRLYSNANYYLQRKYNLAKKYF